LTLRKNCECVRVGSNDIEGLAVIEGESDGPMDKSGFVVLV